MARAYGKGFPSNRTWNKGKRKSKLKQSGLPLKQWQIDYENNRK
jgi:hypothetical protein